MFFKLLGIVFRSRAAWYLHDLIPYFDELTLGNFKIASPPKLELELRAVNNSEMLEVSFPSQLLETLYSTFLQVFGLLMCYIHF